MQTLFDFLRLEAAELRTSFLKASVSGRGTPQEVADFREHAVQSFLERFFPFPYRIAKGSIRDAHGNSSDSIDCVLCCPDHPHTVDSHGKFQLLLADGVDAAIEVKPDIANRVELERGLAQGISVKGLRRVQSGLIHHSPESQFGQYAHRVPYFIFAMKAKADPLDTGREIVAYYKEWETPRLDQADAVCVNDVGLFVNIQTAEMYPWGVPPPGDEKCGWWFTEWGDSALIGFLMHLHMVPHARMKMQEELLFPYLKQAKFNRLVRLQ